MSKFWTVVTIILITGIALLAVDRDEAAPGVDFSDLETECRYDTGNNTAIGLDSKRITFNGRFQTESTNTRLDYDYSVSKPNNIRLNIITRDSIIPDSFVDNCLGSVVYEAETQPLEQGNYVVTVLHDGERQERVGIKVE